MAAVTTTGRWGIGVTLRCGRAQMSTSGTTTGAVIIGGLDGLEWFTFAVHGPRTAAGMASPFARRARRIGRLIGVVNVGVYGVDGSWVENQTVPITGALVSGTSTSVGRRRPRSSAGR